MKSTAKQLSDTKVELKIVLDKDDLKKAKEAAVELLAKKVKAPGFRKGKAPAKVAEKRLNPNDVAAKTIEIAVHQTVPLAFNEQKKMALMMPDIEVTKYIPGESAEYTAVADVMPEIKIGKYKHLKVKKETLKVTEKDIEEVLDKIAGSYAEKKAVKRKAKEGDEVIIDFTGKIDGKAFSGGSTKDHSLVLGSGEFIPGFEDAIIGHEPGDKFDIDVTFPKDYHVKDLAGKPAVFSTLIKQLNEVKKPKYDDEFAKKCGPFKNLSALKADIKKNLQAQNDYKNQEIYKEKLITAFVENCQVGAPDCLVKDQITQMRNEIAQNAATQGLNFDDYLRQTGQTEQEWTDFARGLAVARVKASLALRTLASEVKIEVDDREVEAKLAELRDTYKKAPDALKDLKNPRVFQEIKTRMLFDKAIDFLVKVNK